MRPMLQTFVELVVGVSLVTFAHYLTIRRLREALNQAGLRRFSLALSIVCFLALEVLAVHLLIDPMIPGKAVIVVRGAELLRRQSAPFDVRVEIDVARFDRTVAAESHVGGARFDSNGVYFAPVTFGWFENYVRIGIYKQSRPETPIQVVWHRVSPWARLGLYEPEIRLR